MRRRKSYSQSLDSSIKSDADDVNGGLFEVISDFTVKLVVSLPVELAWVKKALELDSKLNQIVFLCTAHKLPLVCHLRKNERNNNRAFLGWSSALNLIANQRAQIQHPGSTNIVRIRKGVNRALACSLILKF